jgi:hypothetical protein
MNGVMLRRSIFTALMVAGGAGCDKNPVERLSNPLSDGSVPQSSGVFVIYDDELKTGGGLAFIPGGENQSIDLTDTSEPRRSAHSLRYIWNGEDVFNHDTGLFQHDFAGFQLLVSPDSETFAAATPKNLSAAGYATLSFFVRGSLSSGTRLRIEGPDDGPGGITPQRLELSALDPNWTAVTMSIPAADFASVKIFLTVSFQYTQPPRTTAPGEGGTVFFDEIRYEN